MSAQTFQENYLKINEQRNKADRLLSVLFLITIVLGATVAFPVFILNLKPQQSQNQTTTNTQSDRVAALEKEIKQLNDEVNTYTNILKATPSANIDKLASRVTELETKEGAISESILVDPDKAVTASLLREKQQPDENSITDLKKAISDTNNRIDALETGTINDLLLGFFLILAVSFIAGVFRFVVWPFLPMNRQKTNKAT